MDMQEVFNNCTLPETLRIFWDREIIVNTRVKLLADVDQLFNQRWMENGREPDLFRGTDLEGWDGPAVEMFKGVMNDLDIRNVLIKYGDYMSRFSPLHHQFNHALKLSFLFEEAVFEVYPGQDALELANFITENETFRRAARIEGLSGNMRTSALTLLAYKLPAEEKRNFFSKLEDSGLLSDLWSSGKKIHTSNVAAFLTTVFDGTDTETALEILKNSWAWKNYLDVYEEDRKTWINSMARGLDSFLSDEDERLLPALQYTNGPGQQPSPER